MLHIQHASLLTPFERLDDGELLIIGARIEALGPAGSLQPPPGCGSLDARGLVLAPGFIDLQINGGFGADFSQSPAEIWWVGQQLAQFGVTAFLPTLVSSPSEYYKRALDILAPCAASGCLGAQPLGFHFEGPFINPVNNGAHDEAFIKMADLDLIAD